MSFKTHKLNEKGCKEIAEFKTKTKKLLHSLGCTDEVEPSNRDFALAKTKLEEFSFWATKFIASQSDSHTEVIEY